MPHRRHLAVLRVALLSLFVFAHAPNSFADGDLAYPYSCETSMELQGYDVGIQLEIWSRGEQTGGDWFEGYGFVLASYASEIPSSEQGFVAYCFATYYVYYFDDWSGWDWYMVDEDQSEIAFPGAGPRENYVLIEAFIPYEWLAKPWDPAEPTEDDKVMEGDERGFGFHQFGASYRLATAFQLLNPAYEDIDFGSLAPMHSTGTSVEYHAESSLTDYPNMGWGPPAGGGSLRQEAKDDWIPDNYLKVRYTNPSNAGMGCYSPLRLGQTEGEGTSAHSIYCWGAASYPFHSVAPSIDWEVTLTFKYGFDKVEGKAEGCKDEFPAHAAYGRETTVLYETPDNENPYSVGYPCSNFSVGYRIL